MIGFDATVDHRHDTVGVVCERQVVGDEDDRRAVVGEPGEQLEHCVSVGLVEAAGRLVRDEQRRLADHRSCDPDALLFAAAHLGGQLSCQPAEPDLLERAAGPCAAFTTSDPTGAELDREFDVLDRGECRQQVEVLEDDPDVLTTPRGEAVGTHLVDPVTSDDQ